MNRICNLKNGHEPQWRRANRASDLRHTQARFATITTSCNRLPFGLCVPFPTRQKLRFHLSYSRTSSLVFDVREPLCVKYENAWHCVAQAATQAKWHNKRNGVSYVSTECCPPLCGHRGFPCKGER